MGQDVEVNQQIKSADDGKEVTYTSNDEEESYEPDFQSEIEGPFTAEEQQWYDKMLQLIAKLEGSYNVGPYTS